MKPSARGGAIDAPYHHLAALPRALWLPTLVCGVGASQARLLHAHTWLQALGQGQLPGAEAHFGDPAATHPLRAAAAALNLPALAQGVPAVAEQVLRTLLWHLDQIADLQDPLTRAQAIRTAAASFQAEWQEQKSSLEPELRLLQQWADTSRLTWDQLQGQLHRREWQAARAAAERLLRLPDLLALLQRLGRRESGAARRRSAPAAVAAPAPEQRLKPVRTELAGAPGEITGIRLSHSIEHMLPSEALGLRHPVLRRLWRARQAEGRLLAYDTRAEVIDWRADPRGHPQTPPPADPRQTLERGPIVLCLDTSGSMRGAPEHIAKAVTMAALRLAHQQGRACKLVTFGGPGELVERDLTQDSAGLQAVLDLMGQAFDGGTDVQTPIEHALAVVQQQAWLGADLLIVSDGEFGCVRATLQRLQQVREEQGLFVQGVLVGDRETMGMLEVCDHIHWVREWRRFGDAATAERTAGFSPVHSKSLTALFFPGALSPQAARHGRSS
jgi:uncharacterized protein with von Willebrand factor type A (vWA) domain